MHTSVVNQKLVTVTMSVEEWAEWLANPQTLLVQIQNLALAAEEVGSSNRNKPRKSPKARTAKAARKGARRKVIKTGTTYICPECQKQFRKEGNLARHIDRMHMSAAQPVTD